MGKGCALPRDEILAMLKTCSPSMLGARDRAVVVLAWRCGLRSREITELELRDFDPRAGLVHVRSALKRGDPRVVGVGPLEASAVEAWLRHREKIAGACSRLFVSSKGRALDTSQVRKLVYKLARRAGIASEVWPHRLRHTYASELCSEGVNIRTIQQALGHKRLDTTQIYLAQVSPDAMAQMARSRPDWRE